MKFISWNINGIRAAAKKGFYGSLKNLDADIFCLQETKANDDQVKVILDDIEGYKFFSNSAERKGYSGTAILSNMDPVNVTRDIGIKEHDKEGRVITAEFDSFYLVNVYVPNSGSELNRLPYRKDWDRDFLKYLKQLEEHKPVIACGDFNVAHQPIDIARPKPNYNKSAGYTQIEIDGMTNFIEAGFIDTFRHLHPGKVAYSWWSYRFHARAKNIGWRIDYFLTSKSILEGVDSSFILPNYEGSDHCPVGIEVLI